MSSQKEIVDLQALMREKYPSDTTELKPAIYHVNHFAVVDSQNYKNVAYLKCEEGNFRTTSATICGSLKGEVGRLIAAENEKGYTVKVEVINKKANTGRIGLSFKVFDNQKSEVIENPKTQS